MSQQFRLRYFPRIAEDIESINLRGIMSPKRNHRSEMSGLELAKADPMMPDLDESWMFAQTANLKVPRTSEPVLLAHFFTGEVPIEKPEAIYSNIHKRSRKLPPPPTYSNGCVDFEHGFLQLPVISTPQQLSSARTKFTSQHSPLGVHPVTHSLPSHEYAPRSASRPTFDVWPQPPITRNPLHGNYDRNRLAAIQRSAFGGQSVDLLRTLSSERHRSEECQYCRLSRANVDDLRDKWAAAVKKFVPKSTTCVRDLRNSAHPLDMSSKGSGFLKTQSSHHTHPQDVIAHIDPFPAQSFKRQPATKSESAESSPDFVGRCNLHTLARTNEDLNRLEETNFATLDDVTPSATSEEKTSSITKFEDMSEDGPKAETVQDNGINDSDDSDCNPDDSCESTHPNRGDSPPSDGYDPINGRKRKRTTTEELEEPQEEQYSKRWNGLCAKPLRARGHICGYEEGDRHYTFQEWQQLKAQRVCRPGQIRDPISGRVRKRMLIDDCSQGFQDCKLSTRWDNLCRELDNRSEARKKIWGYRDGDLDLSWEELKEARTSRAGWWL